MNKKETFSFLLLKATKLTKARSKEMGCNGFIEASMLGPAENAAEY
jgi:hypothetical protein